MQCVYNCRASIEEHAFKEYEDVNEGDRVTQIDV